MQGMEQEVCQLFFATLCRKIDSKWQGLAVKSGKAATKGQKSARQPGFLPIGQGFAFQDPFF